MVSFASQLLGQSKNFAGRVSQMGRDVDKVAQGWRGKGATAASARALGERMSATNIDEVVVAVAGYLNLYGKQLDQTRTTLLNIVDKEAAGAGMKVADDGSVTPATFPNCGQNPLVCRVMQQRLNEQAAFVEARIKEQLKNFANGEKQAATMLKQGVKFLRVLEKAPTTPMRSKDGRYALGMPERPGIPHDDTFPYNTKDANFGDYLSMLKWQAKLSGAEAFTGLDDATMMYRHYWENNGKPMEFDLSEAYREDSVIKNAIDQEIGRAIAAADQFAQAGNKNFQMTGARTDVDKNPATENWQKTIGRHHQWSYSNVRVEGNRVVMDVTVEARDYYNFNKGENDIATGISDKQNGRFAEIGWAKPFESHGSLKRTVSWEMGHPPAAGSGDTSDPQRNQGREDRTDNRHSGDGKRAPDNDRDTGRVGYK
ncbi:hypothetical protein NDR87_29945 [Nocardia sp. CDC159]|uniref:Uncharacterized protein n=1 Tax=Nocardia pulmonis TaxID=2951408 RepID=A0A9X2EB24_9NOCA|nr:MULTISPECIES: hypothetical protein [Nocardia]MCM6777597.1 hypothetical protein [Nocardia pulmonis]MCM6790599.1 hypothetical protein [Nocardia sp. CDC159]